MNIATPVINTDPSQNQILIRSLLMSALRVNKAGSRLIAHVPTYLMDMDYSYQREIKHNGLVSRWDADKSQLITLSYRKGTPDRLYIIDGQHRVDAARRNGTEYLAAEIFIDLTLEDEAKMFATQNDCTAKLATSDTFKANLVYGQTVDTIIDRVCRKHGVTVSRAKKAKNISALGEVRNNVKMYGEDCLDWILGLLNDSDWDVHKQPYTAGWMSAFRYAYGENLFDVAKARDNLVSVLKQCNPTMVSTYASVVFPNLEGRKAIKVALEKIAGGLVSAEDIAKATNKHM